MDAANRFHTEQTWRWVRAEHVMLVAALTVVGLLHAREIAWGRFAAAWAAASGSFEWAMLALPIHLSGDRGFFGNTYKPASLPFEPVPHAAVADPRRGALR